MKTVYTLENAVMEYGNDAQIDAFNKAKESSVKGKGNLKTKQFDALIKTILQHFESVEVDGKGSTRTFICVGKRNEILDRKELQNYANSGNRDQMLYKDLFEQLVMFYLNSENRKLTTTYKVLAHKSGAMSDVLFFASKNVTVEEQKNYYKYVNDKYKKHGHDIFWDVIGTESQTIIRNVKSVVKDMEVKKIIRYMDVVNAVELDEYGFECPHEPIHPLLAKQIDDKKTELCEKHDVTHTDIRYKPKSPAVIAYKEEEYEYLQSLGYEYVYDAVMIYFTATDKETKNYMKESVIADFKKEYLAVAHKKAMKRENSSVNDTIKVKDNLKLHKEFGGKKKSEVLKLSAFDGIDVLDLADKELIYDSIKLEKLNGTYANSYKESLKTIQVVKEEATA